MPRGYEKLTRIACRALKVGSSLHENGIIYTKLSNGYGRWRINVMVNGVRIHRTVGHDKDGTTREKVKAILMKLVADARDERLNLPQGRKLSLTFQECAKKYQKLMEESGGNNLIKKKEHLDNQLIPFFKQMAMDKITEFDIARYKKFRAGCLTKRNRLVSGATINRELATLSHLFNTALRLGWIKCKPASFGLDPKAEASRIVCFTLKEAASLRAEAKKHHHQTYLFVRMGLATGMRCQEILTVQIANINFKEQSIFLPKTKTGPDTQKIPPKMMEYLDWYIKAYCRGQKWLFPSTLKPGQPRETMRDAFRSIVASIGLCPNTYTPHVMRHTVGTWMNEAGVNDRVTMTFMRHKTDLMNKRYTHIADQRVSEAANQLENFGTTTQELHTDQNLSNINIQTINVSGYGKGTQ